MKALAILGTRGVPAAHGGFETFAERLALHLVRQGWQVTVYCQEEGSGPAFEDRWQGIRRVRIPVAGEGPASTIVFDWKATRQAARERVPCLTLGYNTAVFCARLRLARVPNVINMDGVEWQRDKWNAVAKVWFWLNEHAGSRLGDHLVADHPEISLHLQRHTAAGNITTIPYGADRLQQGLDDGPVRQLGLVPEHYATLVARPEPENSVLEVVRGWSQRSRGCLLAVLGHYHDDHPYHCAVKAAAGPEVRFVGAIYERSVLQALRVHGRLYVHGHRVGGTNPSLVEALGAGNAIVAHDNRFNRWVAGDAALYLRTAEDFAAALDRVLGDDALARRMRVAASSRHEDEFTWAAVLDAYESLLSRWCTERASGRGGASAPDTPRR